jgi:hypothetical protein
MDEVRIITIDPDVNPEPVFKTLLSGYTHAVELCYDVRIGDTEQMQEVSLFMSRLQPLLFESAWKPLDHPGLKALSRERALMEIEWLLAAQLPEDLNGFENTQDQRMAWLKFTAFVRGFKPWTYGMDYGIHPIWTGGNRRIHLHNLIGGENKREYTWELSLYRPQKFVFDDPRKEFIPTLIQHKGEKEPEPMAGIPRRTYTRKKKDQQ